MKRLLLPIVLLAFLWPSTAIPADPPATLKLQNRPIITLRGNMLGYTPKQRVEAAEMRINAVIERGVWGTVTTKTISGGLLIQIGDQWMFAITPGDLDPLAGETTEEAVAKTVRNLTTALGEIEESRKTETYLRGIGYTFAATLILLLVLAGFRRSHRWLSARLAGVVGPRLKTLAIGGFTHHIEGIILFLKGLVGLAAWALSLFLFYLWLDFSFMQFPYTRPWGEQLENYMTSGIKAIALTIVNFIPGLVIVAVIFMITRFLSRIGRLFFDGVESGRVSVRGLYAETAQPTRRIVTVILWLFALVMMYPYLPGSESDAFKGMSVFVGLLLSIGSAGTVNQAVSGLMLMYSRALRAGDYVQIGETEGTVVTLGMFSTRIRTPRGEIVSLPNAVIVGTTTKNYSREEETGGVILTTTVTIGYNAPWRQVHAMLIEAAHRTEGLLKDPPPRVLQRSLSDYYVEYLLGARIAQPNTRIAVLDTLHRNIQDVFNEYGVQIMSPHYMADPDEKVWVPKEKWHEAPAQKDAESK
jgi:small-conductance mechanosensitive channel